MLRNRNEYVYVSSSLKHLDYLYCKIIVLKWNKLPDEIKEVELSMNGSNMPFKRKLKNGCGATLKIIS